MATKTVKPVLKVCFSCNGRTFSFSDNTGPWDATLNPYGWAPNGSGDAIEIDDVTSSALTITAPDGTVYGPYDVSSSIPALDGVQHDIDLSDILGSGDAATYADGYWSFDWVVKGAYAVGMFTTPFQARCLVQRLVLCDVECCVNRLMADIDPTCGCSKTGSKKALNAMLTLEAVKAADRCGQKEKAKKHLKNLQDICGNNCKNC